MDQRISEALSNIDEFTTNVAGDLSALADQIESLREQLAGAQTPEQVEQLTGEIVTAIRNRAESLRVVANMNGDEIVIPPVPPAIPDGSQPGDESSGG